MTARATRSVPVWLALVAVGCANTLTWSVEAPELGPAEGDTSTIEHLWAVTDGACTERPGSVIAAGEVHGTGVSAPLRQGTFCFWSMQVRRFSRASADDVRTAPCRLESIASQTRSLPGQQGQLLLSEERIDDDAARAVWDAAVEQLTSAEPLVACAPRRDPARCDCPFSPSPDRDPAGCAPAIDGDLVAMSAEHTCVGRTGAERVTCWGEQRGFGAGTGRVGPTEVPTLVTASNLAAAIVELDTGPGLTCARTEVGLVHCVGPLADELAGAGWPLTPLLSTNTPMAVRIFAQQVGVGDEMVCALGQASFDGTIAAGSLARAAVYCRGRQAAGDSVTGWSLLPPPGSVPISLSVGARHLCVVVVEANQSRVYCAGDNRDGQSDPMRRDLPPWELHQVSLGAIQSIRQVVAGANRTCAIAPNGALFCWGAGLITDPTQFDPTHPFERDVSNVRIDEELLCVSYVSGEVRCARWRDCAGSTFAQCRATWSIGWSSGAEPPMHVAGMPDLAARVTLPAIGGEGLCGFGGRDGDLLCAPLGTDRDAVGLTATTTDRQRVPGRSAVCPYPFGVP